MDRIILTPYLLSVNETLLLDGAFVTLDVGDVEVGAGTVVAFYVTSTERLMAGPLSELDPSDDVVTLLGPTRYVHSGGGLFGSDYYNVTW